MYYPCTRSNQIIIIINCSVLYSMIIDELEYHTFFQQLNKDQQLVFKMLSTKILHHDFISGVRSNKTLALKLII